MCVEGFWVGWNYGNECMLEWGVVGGLSCINVCRSFRGCWV